MEKLWKLLFLWSYEIFYGFLWCLCDILAGRAVIASDFLHESGASFKINPFFVLIFNHYYFVALDLTIKRNQQLGEFKTFTEFRWKDSAFKILEEPNVEVGGSDLDICSIISPSPARHGNIKVFKLSADPLCKLGFYIVSFFFRFMS